MAALCRNLLFFNQLRQFHRSAVAFNVPSLDMNTESKAFLDVLPEVIDSMVTAPKLNDMPEVCSWMKKPVGSMATLIRRNQVLYSQLRRIHQSSDGHRGRTFNMKTEKKAFQDVLPEVINAVVTGPKLTELPEVRSWIKKILDYMLGGGKLGRGLMVSVGYRMFEEPENFSEKTQHSARVLGWCTEMMQSTFLIFDDITDNATMRRGKPCWHIQQNTGLNGFNDSLLLYQSFLEVLNIYFGETPLYPEVIKYFNEACYRATMAEHLDLWSSYSKEKNNLHVFNMNLINAIAINKSAYYTYKLPIFVALLLVKNGKQKATEELSNICFEFGRLMQCQDDYMDVYGSDTITGKSSRDIQEGKCTWVAVTALQHCNDAQRAVFKEYYGSKDPEHVERIKQLYDELHLPELYDECERNMYKDIMRQIHALPHERDRIFLSEVLNVNYRRVN